MPTERLSGHREPWLKTLNYTFWSASHFHFGVLSDLADRKCYAQRIEPLTHLLKSLRIDPAFAADLDVVNAARRDSQVRRSRDAPGHGPPYSIGDDSKDNRNPPNHYSTTT